MKSFYNEHYNPGKIKGSSSYVEEVRFSKMPQTYDQKEITIEAVIETYENTEKTEAKRKKETLDMFKKYLKQKYPLDF